MTKTIGEKILELRKSRSLTQEKLGEQLGISSQAVSKWENGDSMPDILILPQLCEILGISIDALLEVPQSIKKDNVMKIFDNYAKEVGSPTALLEAFTYCTREVKVAQNVTLKREKDEKSFMFGYNWIEIIEPNDSGYIISRDKFKEKMEDASVQQITNFFSLFADERYISILKEITINTVLTKEELVEKTGLSLEVINQILFVLLENNICVLISSNGKTGYTLGIGSHILYIALSAFFISRPPYSASNVSKQFI